MRPLLDAIPNSWWESIQQTTIRGTPDIIGCVRGVFVGLELKATTKSHVTELQRFKLRKIVEAGGHGYILHPDNLYEVIERLHRI